MPAQCFSRQSMDRRRPSSAGPGVRILSEVGGDRRVPPLQEEGGWPGAGFSVRSDLGGTLGQPCTFNRGRCRMASVLFDSFETLFGLRRRAAPEPAAGQLPEEAFDRGCPGAEGRRGVEGPAGMALQPSNVPMTTVSRGRPNSDPQGFRSGMSRLGFEFYAPRSRPEA